MPMRAYTGPSIRRVPSRDAFFKRNSSGSILSCAQISSITVSVAIAAALGTHEPLRGQLRIALNNGITKEEVVELFIHLEAYAGAARAFDSYQVVLAVFAESSTT